MRVYDPDFAGGPEWTAGRKARHHLVTVRRLAPGERVAVLDGRGLVGAGTASAVSRTGLQVAIEAVYRGVRRQRVAVHLAAPKAQRLEWAVEKLTELGAAEIRFLETERSQRRNTMAGNRLHRLQRIAAEALEQSAGLWLPEFGGPAGLSASLATHLPGTTLYYAAWEGITPPLAASGSVAVYVGPEGGFSAAEIELLDARGARPLGLGPNILRVETSAVVAAAVLPVRDSINYHSVTEQCPDTRPKES